jgi:Fe2+ or Zn2+ uptake regulation protein
MLDVTVPPEIEAQLDEALSKLAVGSGFTLHHHRLDLVGRCAKCK